MYVEIAREFAKDVVAPNAQTWEETRTFPREVFTQAADAGLAGLLVPPELGGSGLGVMAIAEVMESLAAACLPFAFSLVVHNNLAGNIARNGSEEQQARYLPDMISGARIGAFLLTEPSGGSDAAAILTRGEPTNDGWRLHGEKAWVSNGAVANVLSVYAQTDPAEGWRGITCFLIDADREGVIREAPYSLMGGHALGTAAFSFAGCAATDADILLPPVRAFKEAMAGIDLARVNVAAMCCGILDNGLDCAVKYTKSRSAFGQRTADFQGLQWMLADAATDLEAARLLTYEAARELEAGREATLAAAHAKKFATRAAFNRLADCMQTMGAAGYRSDCPLGRHLASAKMAQYLDGTTEIQNVVISRRLFAEPS
jgi:alkylation response protein AidB-like acyl-CoA dehydrogenase